MCARAGETRTPCYVLKRVCCAVCVCVLCVFGVFTGPFTGPVRINPVLRGIFLFYVRSGYSFLPPQLQLVLSLLPPAKEGSRRSMLS